MTQGKHSLELIPAVDLLGEGVVRLERGDFDRIVAREADPVALVKRFVEAGARLVHVVDLDGARSGRVRPELVRRLAVVAAPARIQASGGVRSLADAERLLEAGADRVVVGTAAFAAPRALERYAAALDGRLVVAVDVRAGRVVTRGWSLETEMTAEEAAERCAAAGVSRILCTSVDRDGTLAGPHLELLTRVRERSGVPVLAAGGIRSQADLVAVEGLGCEGAIVGRALLEGRLPLSTLAAHG
ncbi:MAG: 1-(5-phosphoribosyl)-5-[(5-phosphoribosylamino)methylideneamino] imidazole-4-carboxamide isomerase [Thermoleophilaceae bacterium]|nr:1-(5-phosphoribosyl)-5-[(5-phosphoribosylamino)methylideneamino] imidazole-4-carboxamide isomerase [Thermoleophilaceae bacterium]